MNPVLKGNLLLLTAAFFWGTTFVAQRVGMQDIGPLAFSGIRFAMGTLMLVPFLFWHRTRTGPVHKGSFSNRKAFWGICIAGVVLCLGINLQQFGLVYTTAANAAFITGLYVVIVPFMGMLLKQYPGWGGVLGASIAVAGLYLLSMTRGMSLSLGDGLVLFGAFVWAAHVLVIGWLSPRMNSYVLAAGQFAVVAVLSLAGALLFEQTTMEGVLAAGLPLVYGGVLSVGVGFTLQVVAQQHSPPTHAAVIMSLEAVFGAVGGWMILNEILSGRQVVGCLLMLAGMLITQLWPTRSSAQAG